MTDSHFPLSAVVGADVLKLALCLAAIDPAIGGVLIEGPRGMAKSTLARGLADLLASGTFVTLPLGASEERIVGTLDLDAALGEGRAQFSPGLLAKANGGVLYVDEVNLLPDHLVDLLLDAAASGVNHIERDGISHRHAARFVLIGTMNGEEGELRPQLLDRFGLNLALSGLPQPAERAEIVRRRLAFDADPQMFLQRWAAPQEELRARCQQAREQLSDIALDDAALNAISQRCFDAEDIEAVADFVLRHRQRHSSPPATPPAPQQPSSPQSPPAQSEAESSAAKQPQGEGQWGELPAQPQSIGIRREPPRWTKKP
jgi:magnesium chelatase subunit I